MKTSLLRFVRARVADPRRVVSFALGIAALTLAACSQTPVTVTLHSLQASGNLSFVCQGNDGYGLKLDECPDYENQRRRILGLVTQTATNEVAIVDLRAGAVVDVDPSSPGYTFLRVGARPGAIVSTPGGAASFVGVTGLQKNGIFALPTTCLQAPTAGQAPRDLTSWSACALGSAPGDMQVVIDPGLPGGACPAPSPSSSIAQFGDMTHLPRECPAYLGDGSGSGGSADRHGEGGPIGHRKLLVALPEEHRLVLLDAQGLLDRRPGEFNACTVEASYPLNAALPSGPISPKLPPDLQPAANASQSCQQIQYPAASATEPTPADIAVSGNRLYVADSTLPVVHSIDISDPCAPVENAPLLPFSYESPSRVVTTSRVAVSPLPPVVTPTGEQFAGKQFVYAIDNTDQPTASVMVFDVTGSEASRADVASRTPVVFPGAPRQPYSSPDRLRFSAPVRDVTFVMRDFPEPDPVTGVGEFGLACNPDPNLSTTDPAAQFRPNSDFSQGARPVNLRGVFGFAMLTNGQVAVIDVQDFDAPCRRPLVANTTSSTDFRGCPPDPAGTPYFTAGETVDGTPTVTNEVSCNIIEPNRARAQYLAISDSTVGLRAPSLRGLPQFANPDPTAVVTAGAQPHLLAVNFSNPDSSGMPIPAQVNVSGQLYAACQATGSNEPPPCNESPFPLVTDPTIASSNSLTLPLVEPRSYAPSETPVLTFEGRVFADRTSGFLTTDGTTGTISDSDAGFCAAGVEDGEAIKVEANGLGVSRDTESTWSTAHADYVQITGDFLPSTDAYWDRGLGHSCADPLRSTLSGYDACVATFGSISDPNNLKHTRDLTIASAYNDHLVVTPRPDANADPPVEVSLDAVKCCFPTGTAYTVRASHQWVLSGSGGLHDIAATGTDGRCTHTASCDPRKKYFHSRAFEVCNPTSPGSKERFSGDDICAAASANVGCILPSPGAVEPGGDASQCIFENLTSRFVVYRGTQVSTRDMTFSWSTTGGFSPLSMSLATQSTAVNPQSMEYIPELGYLAVVDGSTLGLALFDLNSLGLVTPSPFF